MKANYSLGQSVQEKKLIDSLRMVAKSPEKLKHICFQLLKSNNQVSLFEGNYGLGYANLITSKLDSSSFYYSKALQYARLQDNKSQISMSLLKLQTVYSSLGKQDSLLKYIEISKEFAEESSDLRLLAESFKYEGIYFKNIKNYEASINATIEAAKINKRMNNPMLVNNYGNIAIAYRRMAQDSLAYEWFLKAFKTSKEFTYFPAKFGATNNLANFHYTSLHQLDSAKYYYHLLLQDSLKLNPNQENIINFNLFSIHIEQDSLVNAEANLKQLTMYWKNKPDSRRKAEFYEEVSQYFIKKREFETALAYNDSSLTFVKNQQINDKILFLMLERSRIYEELNELKKANHLYREFIDLKDSLLVGQDSEAIQNSINQFELDLREEQLKQQLEKSSKTNYSFVWMGLLLSIGIVIAYKRQKKSKQQVTPTYITLSSNEKVNCSHIEYIKADGHYIEYYLTGKEKPIYERNTLKFTLERLNECPFIQTQRSYLVNTTKITRIQSKEIILSSGVSIPLSKSFKEKLVKENHPLFL